MTKNTTKALLLLLLISAIVVAVSGCTSSPAVTPTPAPTATLAANATVTPVTGAPNFTTIQPGVLLVPVDSSFPPMEWLDMNTTDQQAQFVGFDMDLMRAIGQKLNVTPQFTTHSFDTIINDVQTHKYDLSISSFSITGERQGMVLFSKPYFQVQQTIVVRADDTSISNASRPCEQGQSSGSTERDHRRSNSSEPDRREREQDRPVQDQAVRHR